MGLVPRSQHGNNDRLITATIMIIDFIAMEKILDESEKIKHLESILHMKARSL